LIEIKESNFRTTGKIILTPTMHIMLV